MAAPLQTFLFQYGSLMEGKSIGLIVSSSSSGISGVESDARRLIPVATSSNRACGYVRAKRPTATQWLPTGWVKSIKKQDYETVIYIFIAARSGNDFAGCGAGDDSSEIDIPEVPNDPGNDDDDNDNSGTVTPETERFWLPGSAVGEYELCGGCGCHDRGKHPCR